MTLVHTNLEVLDNHLVLVLHLVHASLYMILCYQAVQVVLEAL